MTLKVTLDNWNWCLQPCVYLASCNISEVLPFLRDAVQLQLNIYCTFIYDLWN